MDAMVRETRIANAGDAKSTKRERSIPHMSSYGIFRAALACTALVVAVASPASAQKKVTATGLPAGWAAHGLGSELGEDRLLVDQSVTVENGVWTISAGGFDLWTENDGGLIVYTKHSGDGHASFRLLSQEKGNDATTWVKTAAGFRESLSPDSRDVHISYTSDNSLEPAVRVNAAETPKHPNDADSGFVGFNGNGNDDVPRAGRQLDGKPIWIGIDRQGNNFGCYYSEDGKVWTSIANGNIEFPAEMLAGIEATNHNDAQDPTFPNQVSKLDNVEVNSELLRTRSISNLQTKAGTGEVLVTWNPVAASVGDVTYNVYRISADAVTERTKLNTEPLKEASFTAKGLTGGTEYRFGVTAMVGGVESGMQVQFSQEEGAPGIPTVTPN
jgi:hypothetical protein